MELSENLHRQHLHTTFGTVVLQEAEADYGSYFVNWIVLEGNPEISNPFDATTNIRVTGYATVQAVFEINSYTVNVTSAGNGTVSPATLSGVHGTGGLQIQAAADEGYRFVEWDVNGSFVDQRTNQNPATVTLTGDGNIQAIFAINTYTVNVNPGEHGTIAEPLSRVLSGEHNSTATIEATADDG
jgi:hypothetical protein